MQRVSVLLAELLNQFVRFPANRNEQRQNILRFSEVAGFPGVAACVDCTHIPVANPGGDNGEVFRNRKGYFSLNIQVSAIIIISTQRIIKMGNTYIMFNY